MRMQKGLHGHAALHLALVGLCSAALLPKAFDPQTILYGAAYYEE